MANVPYYYDYMNSVGSNEQPANMHVLNTLTGRFFQRYLLKKAMSGIQFENAKATIKPNSYKILNDIAKIFIENPTYIVEVQGHTDNVGKYDYNMDLSERRAQAVRTYLINHGVPAERLTAHGYGPDRPIDDNKTKAGRAKNRRVEFNITFEEVTYETVYDRVQNNNQQ